MRKFQICFLTALAGLSTGCAGVVSLHPLVLPNARGDLFEPAGGETETIFDPALLGTWEEVNPPLGATRYTVSRAESGYSVIAVESGETKGTTMHLMKVGDRRLLDVYYPSDDAPPPVHIFFKLRLEGDTAWVAEMGSRWLQDRLKTSGELRHEVLAEDHDRVVLTASPAELREHLLPYFAEKKSFGEETELRRIK